MSAETKEVLNYPSAIWHGFKALKEEKRLLTPALFEEICQMLKGNDAGIRKIPGTKLASQTGEVIYTPPEGEALIRKKLEELQHFIYTEKELDPLIKLALIHYQFEAIHPFHDGNGRTGRIINILFLIDCGLLDLPILYLSDYFLKNRKLYYQGLQAITEAGKWLEWVNYVLMAILNTATETKERIIAIRHQMSEISQKVKEWLPRIYSKDLVELLFQRPYCKIRFLEEADIAGRDTASLYLKKLEEVGILRSIQRGREKYYINEAFLALLSKPF